MNQKNSTSILVSSRLGVPVCCRKALVTLTQNGLWTSLRSVQKNRCYCQSDRWRTCMETLYRIESEVGRGVMSLAGRTKTDLSKLMCRHSLYGPSGYKNQGVQKNEFCRTKGVFWFTPEGWKHVGYRITRVLNLDGVRYRVVKAPFLEGEHCYRDRYQVVQPKPKRSQYENQQKKVCTKGNYESI